MFPLRNNNSNYDFSVVFRAGIEAYSLKINWSQAQSTFFVLYFIVFIVCYTLNIKIIAPLVHPVLNRQTRTQALYKKS